jgi:hypothetical protein
MSEYNSLMPKNKIYIVKEKGVVTRIIGKREDEIPMKMIAIAMGNLEKKDNSTNVKNLESAVEKVSRTKCSEVKQLYNLLEKYKVEDKQ